MNGRSIPAIVRARGRRSGGCLVFRLMCLGKKLIRHPGKQQSTGRIVAQPRIVNMAVLWRDETRRREESPSGAEMR